MLTQLVSAVHTAPRAGERIASGGQPHPSYVVRDMMRPVLGLRSKINAHVAVGIRRHVSIKADNLDPNSISSDSPAPSSCQKWKNVFMNRQLTRIFAAHISSRRVSTKGTLEVGTRSPSPARVIMNSVVIKMA